MHNLSLKSVSVKSVYHTNIRTHPLGKDIRANRRWTDQRSHTHIPFAPCLYWTRMNIIYNRHNRWHFLWLNHQFPFEKDIRTNVRFARFNRLFVRSFIYSIACFYFSIYSSASLSLRDTGTDIRSNIEMVGGCHWLAIYIFMFCPFSP